MRSFPLPLPGSEPGRLMRPIMTSDAGSFAQATLSRRVPAILQQTVARNDFPADIVAAMAALHDELTGGRVRGLLEPAPDTSLWDALCAPHVGRSWLDVPWYWAEAYFYRRVLEATRYFRPGPWQGRDPYAVVKQAEWLPGAAPAAVARLVADLPADPQARFERLLHASLWGNRVDLSYPVAAHLGATGSRDAERANLLVDDASPVWEHVSACSGGRVAVLADNAGIELAIDLVLIDFLLTSGLAAQVHVQLKPSPFFVSDAMPQDVVHGLDAMLIAGGAAAELARRIDGHVAAGDLQIETHWFNTSSLFYFQMPVDLHAHLGGMDLVIAKGDANYRRLLGDAYWPFETPFSSAVGAFPAPLVALRTCKAELIVGLSAGQAARAAEEDRDWLIDGRRGVIQVRLQRQALV